MSSNEFISRLLMSKKNEQIEKVNDSTLNVLNDCYTSVDECLNKLESHNHEYIEKSKLKLQECKNTLNECISKYTQEDIQERYSDYKLSKNKSIMRTQIENLPEYVDLSGKINNKQINIIKQNNKYEVSITENYKRQILDLSTLRDVLVYLERTNLI